MSICVVVRQVRKLPKEGLQSLNPPPGSIPTNTCNTLYRSEVSLLFNRCRLVSWFNKDTGLSTWKKSNKINQTLRSLTINKEEACNRHSFTHIDFLIVSPSQIITTHSVISDQGETVLTLIVVVVFTSLHVICQTNIQANYQQTVCVL